jgi:hypothetical protein
MGYSAASVWRTTEDDSPDNDGIGTLPTCGIRGGRPYNALQSTLTLIWSGMIV